MTPKTIRLRLIGFILLLGFALATAPSAAVGTDAPDPFGWRDLPDSALLRPDSEAKSRSFRIIEKSEAGMRVEFEHPPLVGSSPDIRDRFQMVLVTPAGGVESVTLESAEKVYYLGDVVVDPTETVEDGGAESRTVLRRIGELRGAVFTVIEFLPLSTLRGNSQANRVWIPRATLDIRFKTPFASPVETSPLLAEAVNAAVFNGEDFPKCLTAPVEEDWIDPERIESWKRPTMRIVTREGGWTSIPARRLMTDWGREIDVEGLSMVRRSPLVRLPAALRESADTLPQSDTPIPFLILTATGEHRREGRIQPGDTLHFLAEQSTFWNDPLDVCWLVHEEADGSTAAEAGAKTSAESSLPRHETALHRETIGEDRLFIEGGVKNELQENFWVDRPMPLRDEGGFRLGLPDWVLDSPHPVRGTLRVVFSSTLRDRYQPAGFFRPIDLAARVGGATITSELSAEPSRQGQDLRFEIPAEAKDATLEVLYTPSRNVSGTPYFDRLVLETEQEMEWDGATVSFDFPQAATGTFEVKRSSEAVWEPPAIVGVAPNGAVISPDSVRVGEQVECDFRTPIRSLHFVSRGDGKAPVSLERFVLPTWVQSPPRVEQLVIGPKVFRTGCEQLVQLNREEGWTSAHIDLGEIFDLFSGGRFSAHALRNFLLWASRSWPQPQPSSVLVVGDSSWDAWGRYPESHRVPNWTPSYHTHAHPDYPTDLWFVEGEPLDRAADWLWGRIPCQTESHLDGYLAKRRAFRSEQGGEWAERMIWISDDNDPVERNVRDILAKTLPIAYRIDPIFLHDHVYVDNFYYGENLARIQELAREEARPLDFGKISPDCNAAILESIDRGAGVCIYYGHSGLNVLGHERVLFGGGSLHSDIPKLQNEGRAPLFFLMTCDVGRFDYTHDRLWKWSYGLAEELLMHPFGGSLALATSTGRGVPSDHEVFLTSCLDAMLYRGAAHAGTMMWAGKLGCLTPVRNNEAVEMFTLLGDPLFPIPIPRMQDRLRPERFRWTPEGDLEIEASPIEPGAAPTLTAATRFDRTGMRRLDGVTWTKSEAGGILFRVPEAHFLEEAWLVYAYEDSDGQPIQGKLALDLASFEKPDWTKGESEGKPNLALSSEDIRFENYSPKSGETVFARVRVHNRGTAPAWRVDVAARDRATGETVLNIADSYPLLRIDRLPPNESAEIRVRWDRWEGVGDHELEIEIDPDGLIDDFDRSDNIAARTIRVLDKADLGWGFIHDSTAGAVVFEQARATPEDWILDADRAELGVWAPLRSYLKQVDRGAMLLVPLTNFGESVSATCTIELSYYRGEESDAFREPIDFIVGPIEPTDVRGAGKKFPILLLPGLDRIRVEIDPSGELEEKNRDNNTLRFKIPEFLWDDIPTLKPNRLPPKVLQRLNPGE